MIIELLVYPRRLIVSNYIFNTLLLYFFLFIKTNTTLNTPSTTQQVENELLNQIQLTDQVYCSN